MGTTFVYNSGESTTPPGTLEKTFGMFFDGTGNNLRNTEIRKKVLQIEEYEFDSATEDEEKIYRKKAKTTKHHWWGYKRSANSFMNDFSNVARMHLSCSNNYRIYTEGIGTHNEKDDDVLGSGYGILDRGILAKVRKGCASLAKKIDKIIKNDDSQLIIGVKLTLDVSGFSRGAAAARNFIYEIQKASYMPLFKEVGTDHHTAFIPIDSYGDEVNEHYFIDGMLPPFGHLGYCLAKAGVDKELIKKLKINVRFVGIYDTVAAYTNNHEKGVSRLKLDELGIAQKVVHFTAMDEHRKNFALTRIKTGIEKNFPGVHSDIGGGYDNEGETVEELEIDYSGRWYRDKYGDPLERTKQSLIEQGWFKDDELKIRRRPFRSYRELTATRTMVQKEYSYLFLHYMEDYASEHLVNNEIVLSTKEKYNISSNKVLQTANNYLNDYVFGEGKEWVLKPKTIQEKTVADVEEEQIQEEVFESIPDFSEEEITYGPYDLEEVEIHDFNRLLKILRHDYFHWSADYDWVGMDPTKDRKRIEI